MIGKTHALTTSLIAGTAIGALGVVLFGAVHAIAIVPIWTRLLGGLPFSLVAGLAMAWALYEMRMQGRFNRGAFAGFAFGFLLWATLLPMTLFGVIVRAAGMHGTDDEWETVAESALALGAGFAAGRLIAGQWRSGLAFGAASLGLALAQAGPIPLTNSARAARLFIGLAIAYPVSGLTLGLISSALSNRLRRVLAPTCDDQRPSHSPPHSLGSPDQGC